ncbi:hypothetical protein KA107_02700 [Candidatus Pacearchaeota archaeon]|nr:hypothetical protein [Candidatus Pacearchaeota archaeon]
MTFGLMYLKSCLNPNKTVADALTDYLCTREEVSSAIVRTRSTSYLSEFNKDDSTITPGYSKMLPPAKERIVSTALALYTVTDDKGNVDWSKLPSYDTIGGRGMARSIPIPSP